MKKTLFIGSTVLDVVVNIDHLPSLMEDINTEKISVSLGGCAYNAANILHQLDLPYVLASPIGTGFFASSVERLLEEENKKPFIKLKNQDNGCCICLVDKDGERTFISHHGAEYLFKKEWLNELDSNEIDYIYVCGLEIEDQTGEDIIEYLKFVQGPQIVFAPGSRILNIQENRMKEMFNLHPILHLNDEEALAYTKQTTIAEAMNHLYEETKNTVIVTAGAKGAYAQTKNGQIYVPTVPVQVIDTIGAGDSHVGALIAGLKKGKNIKQSLQFANQISGKVVSMAGANIKKNQLLEVKNDNK